jgi:hypothetical protein
VEFEGLDRKEFERQYLLDLRGRGMTLLDLLELSFDYHEEISGDALFTIIDLNGPRSIMGRVRAVSEYDFTPIEAERAEGTTAAATEDGVWNLFTDEATTKKFQQFLLAQQVHAAKELGEESFVTGKCNTATICALQDLLNELRLPAVVNQRGDKQQLNVTGTLDLPTIEAFCELLMMERSPTTMADTLQKMQPGRISNIIRGTNDREVLINDILHEAWGETSGEIRVGNRKESLLRKLRASKQ